MIQPPNPELMGAVFSILEEYDVRLPQNHVEMTTAVLMHYLKNYDSGNNYLSKLLDLTPSKARHDKEYLIQDKNTSLTRKIKPESIKFLQMLL